MTDRWNPATQQYEPSADPPERRRGPGVDATDHRDSFDRTAAVHRAQYVRQAALQGQHRDFQPGGRAVGGAGGAVPAPQHVPGIGDRIAQARRNEALQRPGSDAQTEARSVVEELEAAMNGGFSTLGPRMTPRDQRTAAWDQDAYREYDQQWQRQHTVPQPEPQAYTQTIRDVAAALHRSSKTVRRMERDGILPPAQRSSAGARVYSEGQVDVLTRAAEASRVLHSVHPTAEQLADLSARAHAAWQALG